MDTIPAEANPRPQLARNGKFSPTTRNGDCGEIANPSTAYMDVVKPPSIIKQNARYRDCSNHNNDDC